MPEPSRVETPARMCPVCRRQTALNVRERHHDYDLVECATCALVFAHPMSAGSREWYEQHFRAVDFDRESLNDSWEFGQFLRDAPAQGGDLLEIGCGDGLLLAAARRRGYRVVGLDFNPRVAQQAQKLRHAAEVYPWTLEAFREHRPAYRADVVVAHQVLEHLSDPAGFVRLVGKVLRPGGYLALAVPNPRRIGLLFGRESWDYPPHHVTRWSTKALELLLENAGFTIIKLLDEPLALQAITPYYMAKWHTGINTRIERRYLRVQMAETSHAREHESASARIMRRTYRILFHLKRVVTSVVFLPQVVFIFLRSRGTHSGSTLYVLARQAGSGC